MKPLITTLLVACVAVNFSAAGAIDDVVSKFDRHGLWMNGTFIPIHEPLDIESKVLAEKILTSYRESINDLKVLENKDISPLEIGLPGFKAMHVRVTRTSMFPPPLKHIPQDCVIVYRFTGEEIGWWSRIYTIKEKTGPNQSPKTTTMAVTPTASYPSRQP